MKFSMDLFPYQPHEGGERLALDVSIVKHERDSGNTITGSL